MLLHDKLHNFVCQLFTAAIDILLKRTIRAHLGFLGYFWKNPSSFAKKYFSDSWQKARVKLEYFLSSALAPLSSVELSFVCVSFYLFLYPVSCIIYIFLIIGTSSAWANLVFHISICYIFFLYYCFLYFLFTCALYSVFNSYHQQ